MRLVKDYMNNDIMRHALNELTEKTFGFDFECWVTNGYFEGDYIPYSFEEDGKIICNVSANRMYFNQNGVKRFYIQLGTVMTAKERRNQGLASKLIENVIDEYEDKCDGIYLFGDLSALDFYRKLGFEERIQYQYRLKDNVRTDMQRRNVTEEHRNGFVRLDSSDKKSKEAYCEAVRNSVANGAFEQENKYGLQMFYTSNLENVYYAKEIDCFVVMEQDGNTMTLHSVISKKNISLEKVISEINVTYKELKLGFTPGEDEMDLFDSVSFNGGNDYRLFCRGIRLESIEKEKLYFPTFSHA